MKADLLDDVDVASNNFVLSLQRLSVPECTLSLTCTGTMETFKSLFEGLRNSIEACFNWSVHSGLAFIDAKLRASLSNKVAIASSSSTKPIDRAARRIRIIQQFLVVKDEICKQASSADNL
uniref:Uncharacterized protein n=1 Tax=Glossina pallidipes TaxID=7398 RepID=A0A1A9ZEV6_GLOPL